MLVPSSKSLLIQVYPNKARRGGHHGASDQFRFTLAELCWGMPMLVQRTKASALLVTGGVRQDQGCILVKGD